MTSFANSLRRHEYPQRVRWLLWLVAEVSSPYSYVPTGVLSAKLPARAALRYALRLTQAAAASQVTVVASDIPEVIGSAIGLRLLFGTPIWIGIVVTAVSSVMFLALGAYGVRKIETLMGALVGAMSISWLIELCRVRQTFLAHALRPAGCG